MSEGYVKSEDPNEAGSSRRRKLNGPACNGDMRLYACIFVISNGHVHVNDLDSGSRNLFVVPLIVTRGLTLFLSLHPLTKGAGVLGKQFQKMRRRLTVTGASQNIDGMAKLEQQDSMEAKKAKKKDKVRGNKKCWACQRYVSLNAMPCLTTPLASDCRL